MQCDIDQMEASQSAVAVALSCCYRRLNDLFCCIHVHCSRDSQR